jgi:hypothetical protein
VQSVTLEGVKIASLAVLLLAANLCAVAKPSVMMNESPKVVVNGLEFVARVQAAWEMSSSKTPLELQLAIINHTSKRVLFSLFDTIAIEIEDTSGRPVAVGYSRTWTTWPTPLSIEPRGRSVVDETQAFLINVPPQEFMMIDATSGSFQSEELHPGRYLFYFRFGLSKKSVTRWPPKSSELNAPGAPVWFGEGATTKVPFRIVAGP